MFRVKGFVKHNIPLILAVTVFAATFLINQNVAAYGDDYGYYPFITNGLDNFVAKHINHYLHDNGRFIVHVLVTIFLALPKAMWRTVNSLLLGLFVYFGSRVILRNSNALLQNITCLVLLCSGVLALDISITRESVHWLTGSLNYVYPIVLLMFYWYLLERKGNKTLIAVTAFLSAATTEQNAMMTAGLSFLYLTHNIRQKRNKESLVTGFISSIAGMCTVLLSPSVLVRYSLENRKAIPFADLLRSNIKLQWVNFFRRSIPSFTR